MLIAEVVVYSMPIGATASTHSCFAWTPKPNDLKSYFHFDSSVSSDELAKIANDPLRVSQHAFYPLLRFQDKWTKFRGGGANPKHPVKKKVRQLRYAARIDAGIYAKYRAELAPLYDEELTRLGLDDCVVAYRRLPKKGGGNKCNIEIAKDVFEFIQRTGDCVVTVLDIKSYFESLDHKLIKQIWERLLKKPLPSDHQAVFNALTKYSYVDKSKVFDRLRLNEHVAVGNRASRRQRKIDQIRASGRKQICTPAEFRKFVAGGEPRFPSLIQKNGFHFGIPQGTPISDLVANFYLLDFDADLQNFVATKGGLYRRYSDDILLVIPTEHSGDRNMAKDYAQSRITSFGDQLLIQNKKVSICEFGVTPEGIAFSHIGGEASKNGLEYLGFQYDGCRVLLRNSTVSNAWRKVKKRIYGDARRYVRHYRAKDLAWIIANYPRHMVVTNALHDVTINQDNGYKTWTFTKYVNRCTRAYEDFAPAFSRQTSRYRRRADDVCEKALTKALAIHLKT